MKLFLWTVLVAFSISAGFVAKKELVAVKDPAAARDLRTFYRSIRALSGDALLNGTAIAVV